MRFDLMRCVRRQAAGQAAQVHFTRMNIKSGGFVGNRKTVFFSSAFFKEGEMLWQNALWQSIDTDITMSVWSLLVNKFDSVFENSWTLWVLEKFVKNIKFIFLLGAVSSAHCLTARSWNDLCTEYVNEVEFKYKINGI